MTRTAPTTNSPGGTTVDQLTYTYTHRTNRLASVADAVTTDLDWDAKPSEFEYNRVGSMTRMVETLGTNHSRVTDIQVYDERQLPEQLRIRVIEGFDITQRFVYYRYDANGQRIRKQIRETEHGPDIHYERYVRDGMRFIGVFDENNALKSWNLGGAAGLVGRADPDPWLQHPAPRYYVTDHLGSIRAVVNHSGTIIEGRDYYPYGLTMPGRFYVASDTTREGFTGHELDPETGMYYAGARYYSSALARWFVPDPLAEVYPGWSSYNYVGGNPLVFIDPDGKKWATSRDSVRAAEAYAHLERRENDLAAREQRLNDQLVHAERGNNSRRVARLTAERAEVAAMRADVAAARAEIIAMGEVEHITFRFNAMPSDRLYGFLSTDSDGTIVINYIVGDMGNRIHELKHGYQVLEGVLIPRPGSREFGITINNRIEIEVQAFRRQYAATGLVPPSAVGSVRSYSRIDERYVRRIYYLNDGGRERVYPYRGH